MVSHAIKKNEPKTLPHMKAVIDATFEKPVRHFDLIRTIDFKSWLEPYADSSLANLADSHEIRIAMAPFAAAAASGELSDSSATRLSVGVSNERSLPILQAKPVAGDEFEYYPALGVKPLKSRPSFSVSADPRCSGSAAADLAAPGRTPETRSLQVDLLALDSDSTSDSLLKLTEVRPLFCASQPKKKVFVLEDDGVTPIMEADGRTPRVRFVDVSAAEMDCSDNLKQLDKLKDIITVLRNSETFFSALSDFPEHTPEAMHAWWEEFDSTQRQIVTDPARRQAAALSSDTAPDLFSAFDNIVLQHKLDEEARHMWLTRQCSAARQRRRQELVQTGQYSAASLNQNFNCPTTTSMEVAEYKDLHALLSGVLPDTPIAQKHKPFLVLSCGTDPKAIDAFAGYFGTGPAHRAKNKPLLWAWVCEVQEVLEHNEDWTTAKVKVHWYRPAHRSKKQWACAFWTKGSTIDDHTVVWDVDDPQDPSHWYMEEYSISVDQVLGQFDSFHEKNVTEKDANNNAVLDANGKPKKVKGLFLYPFIQLHCESRCHQLHEAHEANLRGMQILASRVNSGPGMQADPGPGSEHVTDAQQPECATVHRLAEAAQAVPNVAMSTLGQALLDVASTAAAATECDAAATCVMALGGTQAAASELGSGNSRRRPRPREPSPTAASLAGFALDLLAGSLTSNMALPVPGATVTAATLSHSPQSTQCGHRLAAAGHRLSGSGPGPGEVLAGKYPTPLSDRSVPSKRKYTHGQASKGAESHSGRGTTSKRQALRR